MTACMRKLLVALNQMIKTNTFWTAGANAGNDLGGSVKNRTTSDPTAPSTLTPNPSAAKQNEAGV